MAADRQAQAALDEAWFAAFPASRAVGERWITEWDPALPEVAQREWIRQVLAEVALPDGEERVREVLDWVEAAAVTYGDSARVLIDHAAEMVLQSDKFAQVYPLTGPTIREHLPVRVAWAQKVVTTYEAAAAGGEHLYEPSIRHREWARAQVARYQAIVNQADPA